MRTCAIVELTQSRRPDEGDCKAYLVDEGKVASVRSAAPGPDEVDRVAARFAALADPTRVRLLHALSLEELCVCDLSKVIGRSMPATSQQLRILREMRLVKFRSVGKLAYYSLAAAWVRPVLRDALANVATELAG